MQMTSEEKNTYELALTMDPCFPSHILAKYIERLIAIVICSYCGEEGERTPEAMLEHVLICSKRPEMKLLKRMEGTFSVVNRLFAACQDAFEFFGDDYFEDDSETAKLVAHLSGALSDAKRVMEAGS